MYYIYPSRALYISLSAENLLRIGLQSTLKWQCDYDGTLIYINQDCKLTQYLQSCIWISSNLVCVEEYLFHLQNDVTLNKECHDSEQKSSHWAYPSYPIGCKHFWVFLTLKFVQLCPTNFKFNVVKEVSSRWQTWSATNERRFNREICPGITSYGFRWMSAQYCFWHTIAQQLEMVSYRRHQDSGIGNWRSQIYSQKPISLDLTIMRLKGRPFWDILVTTSALSCLPRGAKFFF